MEHGFFLRAFGDVVDRLRATCVEDRHRQQRSDIAEARGPESYAIDAHAFAPQHGAEDQPREPFGHRLLATRIGSVELRLRCEKIRATFQQSGWLAGVRRWYGDVAS